MDIQVAKDQFAISLYRAALERAYNEALENFPLLRRIKSRSAIAFLSAIQNYSEEARFSIVEAAVKLRHQKTLSLLHEDVTVSLKQLSSNFREDIRRSLRWQNSNTTTARISRSILAPVLLEQLSQSLGSNYVQTSFFRWTYKTPINSWILETTIALEGEMQLSCGHKIVHPQDVKLILLDQTNILDCLGLGTIAWDLAMEADSQTVIDSLKILCDDFLGMLKNLSQTLPSSDIFNSSINLHNIDQSLLEIGNEFDLRLYAWAKLDAQREVDSNFEFLRRIQSSKAIHSIAILEILRKDDSLNLFNTLIKRTISYKAFTLSGDSWTDEDQDRFESFNKNLLNSSNLPHLEVSLLIRESFKQNSKINRRNLKALVKQQLQSITGSTCKLRGSELIFRTSIKNWNIYTEIDTGGYSQIKYRHWISLGDPDDYRIGSHQGISLMGWLGLGETYWNLLTEETVSGATEVLQQLCSHFLNGALPVILDGL